MSVVAKKMKITAGSLTTAVNGLVNKKYVMRARGEEDRRVVYIWLTEKGEKAYYHHEEFHREMTNAVLNRLDEKEIPVLMKTLDGLSEFFRGYSSGINCGNDNMIIIKENQGKFDVLSKMSYNNPYRE